MVQSGFLRKFGSPLLDRDYDIIPIKRGFKFPQGLPNWQNTIADETQLARWLSNGFSDGGVGVLTRRTPAVDIDVQDPEIVNRLIAWCEDHIGVTVQRVGLAPKTLLVYRAEAPFSKLASKTYEDCLGFRHRVEVLGDGQQFVAFAVHPDTHKPYEWRSAQTLADIDRGKLPTISLDQAEQLVAFFESIAPDEWGVVGQGQTGAILSGANTAETALANAVPPLDVDLDKIEDCLGALKVCVDDYHRWITVGMALHHQFNGSSQGLDLWDAWSQLGAKYDPKAVQKRWKTFEANLSQQRPTTFATVMKWAKVETQKIPSATGFHLLHASDVLAKLGPIDWQIKNYLEANTVGLLFGDPGSYKSFIALDMAFHVAAGKDWHGNAVNQGPVIYVAGEGHGGLARRFAAWERHHGIRLADMPLYVSQRAAHLYDKKAAKDVVGAIRGIADQSGNPAVIVIDTLARNFGGGDENSTADMNIFIDHVDRLLRAEFQCTVLIVHHTGHANKQRARGSMALKGGVDFEFRVEKPEGGMKAVLTCTKMKDAIEPEETWFEGTVVPVGDFEGDMTSLVFEKATAPVQEIKSQLKGKQAELFKLIEKEQPVERDVLRGIAMDEGVFEKADACKRAINELKKKGLISENDKYISVIMEDWGDRT